MGVRLRQWNSEKLFVFVAVILHAFHGIRQSQDIRAKLESQTALWDQQYYNALIDDLEAESCLRDGQSTGPRIKEQSFRTFNSRLLSGRVQSACRNLINRAGGGVLPLMICAPRPADLCWMSWNSNIQP